MSVSCARTGGLSIRQVVTLALVVHTGSAAPASAGQLSSTAPSTSATAHRAPRRGPVRGPAAPPIRQAYSFWIMRAPVSKRDVIEQRRPQRQRCQRYGGHLGGELAQPWCRARIRDCSQWLRPVEAGGIEPPTSACKADVFPLAPRPRATSSLDTRPWRSPPRPRSRIEGRQAV